jgi:coenzyme PQQ precursor peptide PqqA
MGSAAAAASGPDPDRRMRSMKGRDEPMTWETPAFVEVKMDAEINSYQDDFDRDQDDRF